MKRLGVFLILLITISMTSHAQNTVAEGSYFLEVGDSAINLLEEPPVDLSTIDEVYFNISVFLDGVVTVELQYYAGDEQQSYLINKNGNYSFVIAPKSPLLMIVTGVGSASGNYSLTFVDHPDPIMDLFNQALQGVFIFFLIFLVAFVIFQARFVINYFRKSATTAE